MTMGSSRAMGKNSHRAKKSRRCNVKRGSYVCYYTNGKGYWLRREWKPQCSARVFMSGRCQGVKGHKGVHWCFSPSGDFDWNDNDNDPQVDGGAGSTPPGHHEYSSPAKMQKYLYSNHYIDSTVTDKGILEMLEAGETPEPNAAIDRPVTDKATLNLLEKIETRKILPRSIAPTAPTGKRNGAK